MTNFVQIILYLFLQVYLYSQNPKRITVAKVNFTAHGMARKHLMYSC